MSTQKIIKELLDEDLIGAKKEIEDLLYEKLGDHLNETYVELAPTLLGEGKKKKKKKKKKGSKPDFLDLDGDGDEDESMKKAAKDKEMKEDYDEEGEDTESSRQDASPAAATLRPGGAVRDEPGDLSKKKKEILAAIGKAGGANTAGTDGY